MAYFCIFTAISQTFTIKDSLRGNLTELRMCYDVTFYDLFVTVDDNKFSLERSYNIIHFNVISDFNKMQVDLSSNMEIESIQFENINLKFYRLFDAVFIDFSRVLKKGEQASIKILYRGVPKKAKNPPWDGGFSWEKDNNGIPFIGVSCQGLGASSWWPCKDHQSDEPDSMRITCVVRSPLKIIANGNLRRDTLVWNQYFNALANEREWFVNYPINNYGVSINIGNYIHFMDLYISQKDTLKMDYYVLDYNLEKAKSHFQQVTSMMSCFENYFGKYPFWDDGYALVETSYLGMEHQSAIAYGNNFLEGYYGNTSFIDGLKFDYIIVHETGHEWWGYSITTNDIADMWVHEGFCTYSEVLYVECMYGYDAMLSYVNNQKRRVSNKSPIVGPYHVNAKGDSDMYFKGSLMLHTLRNLIANDKLWFKIIRGISTDFKHKTIDGQDIINYFNKMTGFDFTLFFKQYLQNKEIPEFQYNLSKESDKFILKYRWNAISGFDMPVLITLAKKDLWIYPNNKWKEINLSISSTSDLRIRDDLLFIDVKKQ